MPSLNKSAASVIVVLIVSIACAGPSVPTASPSAEPTAPSPGLSPTASPILTPAASPIASPTPSPSPSPTPPAVATPTATAGQTASATASPSQPPDNSARLGWRRIGALGTTPEAGMQVELDGLVGFAAGYVALERIVGSEGQWATRLWFSADGESWQVGAFDEESFVQATASAGRELLAIAQSYGGDTIAWISVDGRQWQPVGQLPSFSVARAAWATGDGWRAVVMEEDEGGPDCPYGCPVAALWSSSDAKAWQRVGEVPLLPGGDVSTAVGTPDGRIVVATDQRPVISTDDGTTWRTIRRAAGCFSGYTERIVTPAEAGAQRWVIYGGGRFACTLSDDFDSWQSVELPAPAELRHSGDVIATPYGLLATADRGCLSTADCPPFVEQFLSQDGLSWTRLDGPIERLAFAERVLISDGPQGVIALALGNSRLPRGVTAWRLTDDGQP